MVSIRKIALLALLQLSGYGLDAFILPSTSSSFGRPSLSYTLPNSALKVATEPAVEKVDSGDDEAPDHMPEMQDIAPTYSAKSSNTNLERYKSDFSYSLSENKKYWNKRATELLTWDHYPYDENNCEGVMTGGFEHGDVSWFAGAKMNICFNAIDRHVQNGGKADHIAMIWEGGKYMILSIFNMMPCNISLQLTTLSIMHTHITIIIR